MAINLFPLSSNWATQGRVSNWLPIESIIDVKSSDFYQNDRGMRVLVDELHTITEKIVEGVGGSVALKRHINRGKMLARERIENLIDPGSAFLEFSQLAGYQMYGDDEVMMCL